MAKIDWRLIGAFAAVYIIWGSTYLAIRFAIETVPPFLMASSRFLIAGALMYGWARLRGVPHPQRVHWEGAAIVGGLLLLGGNGILSWAEQRVPSGLAALLVATVPLWMVLMDSVQRRAVPAGQVIAGLLLGLLGLALLIGPGLWVGNSALDPVGLGAILLASFSWALGSLASRRVQLPKAPMMATATEMLAGGALLLVLSLALGEGGQLSLADISLRSALSLGYLILFGSIVAFTAYVWLLNNTTPARVSTYAYVNPVVAVFLGWAFAGEALTAQTLLAAAVIVAAVVIITTHREKARDEAPQARDENQSPIALPADCLESSATRV
jgi:drug/metabolite transporter (DMT)-like permease